MGDCLCYCLILGYIHAVFEDKYDFTLGINKKENKKPWKY